MSSNFPSDSLHFCESILKKIEQFLITDPDNRKWQYKLSICHFRIGRIQQAKGNFAVALDAYFHSLKILDKFFETDKYNKEWREKLADCNKKIGDIYKEQKELSAALHYYNRSLNVKEYASQIELINAFLDRLNNGQYDYLGSIR